MTKRRTANETTEWFKRLQEAVEAREAAALGFLKRTQGGMEFHDAETVVTAAAHSRRRNRLHVLNLLVPDRICPICKELRVGPRQFVVSTDMKLAVCRSCFHTLRPEADDPLPEISQSEIFPEIVVTPKWRFDGAKLKMLRLRLGVSLTMFAEACGWGQGHQKRLEDYRGVDPASGERLAELPLVSDDARARIMKALALFADRRRVEAVKRLAAHQPKT